MKAVICLLALSAVLAQSAVLTNVSTRQNLNIGSVSDGDRLLSSWSLDRAGVPGVILSHIISNIYVNTVVTAIQANEVGATQYANVFITEGGLNQNNVTIVVQSYRGLGYKYLINIWGR